MRYTARSVLDVAFDGRRVVLPLEALDLGDLSGDGEVLRAAADALGVDVWALAGYSVLRLPTGRVLVRLPLAVRIPRALRAVAVGTLRVLAGAGRRAQRGLSALGGAMGRVLRTVGGLASRALRPVVSGTSWVLDRAARGLRALGRLASRALRPVVSGTSWVLDRAARGLRALGRLAGRAFRPMVSGVSRVLDRAARGFRALGRSAGRWVGAFGRGLAAVARGCHGLVRSAGGAVRSLVDGALRLADRGGRALGRSARRAFRSLGYGIRRVSRAGADPLARCLRLLGRGLRAVGRDLRRRMSRTVRLLDQLLEPVARGLERLSSAFGAARARIGMAWETAATRWRGVRSNLGRWLHVAGERLSGLAVRCWRGVRSAGSWLAGVVRSFGRWLRHGVLGPVLRLAASAGSWLAGVVRSFGRGLGHPWSRLLEPFRWLARSAGRWLAALGRSVGNGWRWLRSAVVARLAPVGRVGVAASRRVAARVARLLRPAAAWLAAWLRVLRAWVFGMAISLWTGRTAEERERDHRLAVLESLLTNPRRGLEALWAQHQPVVRDDPLFYVRLAAWYFRHGEMRDHREVFVAHLALSPLPELREAGLALLRRLPPHQVASVVDFVRGRTVRARGGPAARRGRPCSAGHRLGVAPEGRGRPVRVGLFRNPPRSLRTEVARYLREREASPEAFDGAVLVAREAMKRLYAGLHLRPGPRAQAVLFERAAPEGSRLAEARRLADSRDPEEQARLIRAGRLPFRTLMGRLGRPAPAVLEALVERMTPQEVLNHLATLERWGGLDLPAVRERLQRGPVAAMKAPVAARAAALDGDWADFLHRLAHDNLRRRARLTRPTALLVDASASMERSLEVGRKVASMLAAVADAPLYVYTFAAEARPVRAEGGDYAAWTRAFASVEARGPTSAGAALRALLEEGREVEQIVLVTDQRENHRPAFATVLSRARARAPRPTFCFVTLDGAPSARREGPSDLLHRQCNALGFESADYRFAGDDSTLAELLPLVTRPSRLRLLQEILATEPPRRVTA